MYNPFSLEGKTILVTGASSGIGRATAIECAKLGATLILTGRNVQNLHETLQTLEGGKEHRFIVADLSKEDECGELIASLPMLDGFVCNAGIGKMKNPSSVVFTASISAYGNVAPANGIYGASKSALSTYMKYAALELAGKGIRCNAVHPGRIQTPLIENKLLTMEDVAKDIDVYPLKRYGKPEEVAHAIIYLLSDASLWVTGTHLVIDGGRSLK